jgi:hypothetical protein
MPSFKKYLSNKEKEKLFSEIPFIGKISKIFPKKKELKNDDIPFMGKNPHEMKRKLKEEIATKQSKKADFDSLTGHDRSTDQPANKLSPEAPNEQEVIIHKNAKVKFYHEPTINHDKQLVIWHGKLVHDGIKPTKFANASSPSK